MSELSSALFLITDDNEFRFARFYIVCEAVPLGAPESPLIVCGFVGHTPGTVQTWKDTESMSDAARKKSSDFAFRIATSGCIWNVIISVSRNKTYPVLKCKARGDSPFKVQSTRAPALFYSAAQPTLPRRVCGLPQVHVIPAECR